MRSGWVPPAPAWRSSAPLAAVFGALVGGRVTNCGQQALQEQAAARHEARQCVAARGAACLLVEELGVSSAYASVMLTEGQYYPLRADFPLALSTEDRKMIATQLKGEQWLWVVRSTVAVGRANATFRSNNIQHSDELSGAHPSKFRVARISFSSEPVPHVSRYPSVPSSSSVTAISVSSAHPSGLSVSV